MMRSPFRRLALLLLTGVFFLGAKPDGSSDRALRKLLDTEWTYLMKEFPEWATWVGYPGQNDRLTDLSQAAIAQRNAHAKDFLKQLRTIGRAKLSPANQLNYDLAVKQTEDDIAGQRFPGELMPLNQLGGVHQDIAQLLSMQPAENLKGYRDIIARLKATPRAIDQTIALMELGLKKGITPPQITLRDVADQIKAQIVADPMQSPMLEAFKKMASLSESEQQKLREEAAEVYKTAVAPAFAKLESYFSSTYLPKTRTGIAHSELPDGKDWYAYNARRRTTTNLSPSEIHEIGKSEVKRIHGEMDALIKRIGFKGDFNAFTTHLRTDPKFFFDSAENLLAAYRDIAKRVDPELTKLFGKLPRLPYGIKAVPSYAEKSQTTAYYYSGSIQAFRPGTFFANTYDLKTRPKWEMEALTLHEAVPGHHLQLSIAQELTDVPEFRKQTDYTAFVEGWGLYSESLGEELGMYTDPYAKFGQLTYEMWRAIRLVVDTGMHALGWSRQQAIDYFKDNTGKSEHDIIVEIDRYIVWPGQALAYKIGQLKIRELRTFAHTQLGDKFDVRAFHDEVLSNGALPLDILESHMKGWVAAQKPLSSH